MAGKIRRGKVALRPSRRARALYERLEAGNKPSNPPNRQRAFSVLIAKPTRGFIWLLSITITAAITAVLSAPYFPNFLDRISPNRDPVHIAVETLPNDGESASAQALTGPLKPVIQSNTSSKALPFSLSASKFQQLQQTQFDDSEYLPGPIDGDSFDLWVYRNGGADAGASRRRIIIQGIDRKVVIIGIRADTLSRGPILNGCLLIPSSGGPDEPIVIKLDLDQKKPASTYFKKHVKYLGADESVAFDVVAQTTQKTVTWDLVIELVVDGKRRDMRVPSKSGFLRTTPLLGVESPNDISNDYSEKEFYKTTFLLG